MLSPVDIQKAKQRNPAENLVDVYQGRLPKDIKDVFKIARALVVGNEIVAPVITKMAETPITNVVVKRPSGKDGGSDEKLEDILDKSLQIRQHLTGISLDVYTYHNAFSSVYFAPKRYLVCERCEETAKRMGKEREEVVQNGMPYDSSSIPKYRWLASKLPKWRIKITTEKSGDRRLSDIEFRGKCPSCQKEVVFRREDKIYHNVNSLRLIRWDPFQMDIDHYKALGTNEYYYKFPDEEKKRIKSGDRKILSEYPWAYVQAALNNRLLHINKKSLYHFKMESISGIYDGWGVPRVLSVLTALYSVMTMIKANEATSEGRINDLTILSPQPRGSQYQDDPIGSIGADQWIKQVRSALEDFKKDKTMTALLPFPVQAQSVFGQGRAQLVTGELQLYIRNIVSALGLPEDVVYSGGNYTSIAVAARILANQAEVMRKDYNKYLGFLKDTMSASLRDVDFDSLTAELEPYESPDDIQKTNMMIQMAMGNRFPWSLIYKRFGTDIDEVTEMMIDEAEKFGTISRKVAEMTGRDQAEMERTQEYFRNKMMIEMQRAMQPPAPEGGMPGQPGMEEVAQQMLQQFMQTPPEHWGAMLEEIAAQQPELAQYIQQMLQTQYPDMFQQAMGGETGGEAGGPTSMAPEEMLTGQAGGNGAMNQIAEDSAMPDKRPPRSQQKL